MRLADSGSGIFDMLKHANVTCEPRLIGVREVARLLSCGQRTVYRMADSGAIPVGMKIGGLRRWDVREIQAFIDGGCKPARSKGRGK